MADQCIVCLENLDVQPVLPPELPLSESAAAEPAAESGSSSEPTPTGPDADPVPRTPTETHDNTANIDEDSKIALLPVCGHVLHDTCLRAWTGKANSCPICRQTFHLVHVYDRVGGTKISSYKVEDKKQVAEFDPQAWLDENPDLEEPSTPCPICGNADHEDQLLLCDSCDAPYHTYCVGLDSVPRGHWFCMECADSAAELLAGELDEPEPVQSGIAGRSTGRSEFLPRTLASMRRARRRARSDAWQGAWGQIAGHVYNALNIDLDNDDDDEALEHYRRSQQRRERERREYQRWQQRLNIASRLGAREVFANNLPVLLPRPREHPVLLPPPQETPEEKRAWGALEKAMEADKPSGVTVTPPNHRKRKSRSVTASPSEPAPREPERKLKRPRTRRVPHSGDASSSSAAPRRDVPPPLVSRPARNGAESAQSPVQNANAPSFLSSLLKEVEMSTPSDDENIRSLFAAPRAPPSADPSSPVTSPSPSAYSSPRALSATPPPRGVNDRPGSPLSLSSHIEPIYPPANYSPNRNGDHSDSESKPRAPQHHQPHQNGAASGNANGNAEIRQPRPRRQRPTAAIVARSPDSSPTRVALPYEMKESISRIVKDALKPHWKSGHITAEQYAAINRDLSRKLYDEVDIEAALSDDTRHKCEQIASKEVARAVSDLKA